MVFSFFYVKQVWIQSFPPLKFFSIYNDYEVHEIFCFFLKNPIKRPEEAVRWCRNINRSEIFFIIQRKTPLMELIIDKLTIFLEVE